MAIKLESLSDDDRQALVNELHELGIMPTKLQGSGSPAHVASISANLNDLRQIISMMQMNQNPVFAHIGPQKKIRDEGGGQ